MPNVAILAGNTEYQHLGRLDCCDEDVLALQELLEATAKFDVVELLLNSDSARLKDRITPKFVALNRFVLVVSCAPSLEICYVMELLTRHLRRDWDEFDSQGAEVTRRWWKMNWNAPCDMLVDKICEKLQEAVKESVDAAAAALQRP